MPETIQILSRKQFGFRNPDKTLLSKEYQLGEDMAKKGVTAKLEEAMFVTIPNQVQVAPAWIKQDKMWEWATADGDIMEVHVGAGRAGQAEAEALAQGSDAERLAEEQRRAEAAAQKKAELAVMNKADLIDHAKEAYGLELSSSMKKDDMAEAVLAAHLEQTTEATK